MWPPRYAIERVDADQPYVLKGIALRPLSILYPEAGVTSLAYLALTLYHREKDAEISIISGKMADGTRELQSPTDLGVNLPQRILDTIEQSSTRAAPIVTCPLDRRRQEVFLGDPDPRPSLATTESTVSVSVVVPRTRSALT